MSKRDFFLITYCGGVPQYPGLLTTLDVSVFLASGNFNLTLKTATSKLGEHPHQNQKVFALIISQ